MKILLISVGTMGDMEPLLAIGEILAGKGHPVICAFPEQFRDLAETANLGFSSLGPAYIEMLESEAGKAALGGGGSGLKKFLAFVRLARLSTRINRELIRRQYEIIEGSDPDRIVYNGKAIYPIIWGLKNRGRHTLVSPVPYVHFDRYHTHVAFNSDFGPFLNRATYRLAESGLVTTIRISKRWLGLKEKISRKQLRSALRSNRAIYTISPSLLPRPDDWKEQIKILGYPEREKAADWKPDEALTDFLQRHDKILFITFGSMSNPHPESKTETMVDILERNRIPAVINTASGGLVKPESYDSGLLYFISRVPYRWIFPKIYAVIHHGGSGTTHLALKYGCASMIIPHIIDQFVWNKIIAKTGAGPKGIRIDKINPGKLGPKILELMNNPVYKKRAEEIAGLMAKEDFREEICRCIEES